MASPQLQTTTPTTLSLAQATALGRDIVRHCDPERIILFGSYAYGQPTPDSDLDLMVIMATDNPSGQAGQLRASLKLDYPIDLMVCTPTYYAARLALGDFFFQQVAEQGRVLYDSGRPTLAEAMAHSPIQGPQYEQVGGACLNKLTAEWIERAEEDYQSALLMMQHRLNNNSCFHAQQCVEKYLKAFLQEQQVRFAKSHELDLLLNLCATADPSFAQLQSVISGLKGYAVDSRYPGTSSTPAEAQAASQSASQVRAFVRAKLGI